MKHLFSSYPREFLVKLLIVCSGSTLPIVYLLSMRYPVWLDHILRSLLLSESSKQLWQGDIYPRWLLNVNDGLGSPVLLFQPIMTNYIGALLEPFAFLDPHGFGRLTFLMMCFAGIGAMGCYTWLREFFDETPSQTGALLYCVFPGVMHVYYAAMNHNAVLAVMLFPWMLFVANRMLAQPKSYSVYYAILQALLALTNLWNTLIFSAIPLLYIVVFSSARTRVFNSLVAMLSASLGIMIAAIYWYPVLANQGFIFFADFQRDNLTVSNNFLRLDQAKFTDPVQFWVVWAIFAFSTIPLLVSLWHVGKDAVTEYKKEIIFFAAVFLGAVFMTLPLSEPIWNIFGVLSNVQFPIRFLNIAFPGIVFILTCWFYKTKGMHVCFAASIFAAIFAFLYASNQGYADSWNIHWKTAVEKKLVPQNAHQTIWMRKAGYQESMIPPPRFLNVPASRTISGEADITNINQTSRTITFHANVASSSAQVALKRFYYPGWELGKNTPPAVKIEENDALLAVTLPQGEYSVKLRQPWFPGEKEGLIMSASGILLLLIWGLFAIRSKQKKELPC